MNQLHTMRVFVRVVDVNSFHLAARQLGISAAAVTRSISLLEAHLNARLLHRSTRSLSLTDAGKRYVEGCREILTQIDDVESDLMHAMGSPAGSLRIAAPTAFAVSKLTTLLNAYREQHPKVEFDITNFDARIDMIDGGFDICFSLDRHLPDSTLVVRQLCAMKDVAVASPDYLVQYGTPARPELLSGHTLISLADGSARLLWEFAHGAEIVRLNPHCALSASSAVMVRAAAIEHMGIAVLPAALVQQDIDDGKLVQVLAQYQLNGGAARLSLLYPSRSYLSAKARSFIDFTVARYRVPSVGAGMAIGVAAKPAQTSVASAMAA